MIFALFTWLLRGISPILEKIGISEVSGTGALIVRNLPVVAFLSIMSFTPSIRDELKSLSMKGWIALLVSGVLTALLARWAYFVALKRMQDNFVVFMSIVSSYLILTAIIEQVVSNYALLTDNLFAGVNKCLVNIGWRGFVGIALSIVGIILLESRNVVK